MLTAFLGILLATTLLVSAQTMSFVEPEAGRAPLNNAFDQAKKSIDIYLFTFLDDGITASLAKAVARGVTVRAILEPCSGDSTCPKPNKDGITGCTALLASGIQTKWANQVFPKTHAKTIVIDGSRTLVTTINIEPQSFTTRRDYGLATDDARLIVDFNRVFAQDWGSDDPIMSCSQLPQDRRPDATVQIYATLIVSPDHGREVILGLIASAKASLKIQVEQVDPQTARGIVPAMVTAVKAGVRLQLLMDNPTNQPDNQTVADAINAAGGEALFQKNYRTHAKMMVIDGQRVFIGSQNLTRTSLDERRELGWTTTDQPTIACFQQVFDADWVGRDGHPPNGVCSQMVFQQAQLGSVFDRIAQARAYQGNTWTNDQETPASLAQGLAQLRPTLVSGLIRLDNTDVLAAQQAADFSAIRNAVLATNPNCKFDFVLNGQQYATIDALVNEMKDINSKIKVDQWLIDFYGPAYQQYPDVIDAAIAYAHSQGQAIGGSLYGLEAPPNSDYAVATDQSFQLSQDEIARIRGNYNLPVIVHLNNNAMLQGTPFFNGEACTFVNDYSFDQRSAYLTQLAQNQAAGGYQLLYPVLFPECPAKHTYDALRDGRMVQVYQELLARYNLAAVSTASYNGTALAVESIAAAYGSGLAAATQGADSATLPNMIAGVTVKVKDSAGAERLAPLFFVSPAQVNFQVPAGTAVGTANITIGGSSGIETIVAVAPGLYSATGTGQGPAAAQVLRVGADLSQTYTLTAACDGSGCTATPIDLGVASDQVYLILYGTGIRNRSALSAVNVMVGGVDAPVAYAGAQGSSPGLDQVNALLPRSLAGRGLVDVVLTADGQVSNSVQIAVK